MEYLVGIIVLLVGGLFYVNRKKQQAEVKAILGDTLGQDAQLEKQQIDLKKEIKSIDQRIEELKRNKVSTEDAVRAQDDISLSERAKIARNKFGSEN